MGGALKGSPVCMFMVVCAAVLDDMVGGSTSITGFAALSVFRVERDDRSGDVHVREFLKGVKKIGRGVS